MWMSARSTMLLCAAVLLGASSLGVIVRGIANEDYQSTILTSGTFIATCGMWLAWLLSLILDAIDKATTRARVARRIADFEHTDLTTGGIRRELRSVD